MTLHGPASPIPVEGAPTCPLRSCLNVRLLTLLTLPPLLLSTSRSRVGARILVWTSWAATGPVSLISVWIDGMRCLYDGGSGRRGALRVSHVLRSVFLVVVPLPRRRLREQHVHLLPVAPSGAKPRYALLPHKRTCRWSDTCELAIKCSTKVWRTRSAGILRYVHVSLALLPTC